MLSISEFCMVLMGSKFWETMEKKGMGLGHPGAGDGTLRCGGESIGAAGAPCKVSMVTVPPPSVWGHVSVWDCRTWPSDWGLGTYFSAQESKVRSVPLQRALPQHFHKTGYVCR